MMGGLKVLGWEESRREAVVYSSLEHLVGMNSKDEKEKFSRTTVFGTFQLSI